MSRQAALIGEQHHGRLGLQVEAIRAPEPVRLQPGAHARAAAGRERHQDQRLDQLQVRGCAPLVARGLSIGRGRRWRLHDCRHLGLRFPAQELGDCDCEVPCPCFWADAVQRYAAPRRRARRLADREDVWGVCLVVAVRDVLRRDALRRVRRDADRGRGRQRPEGRIAAAPDLRQVADSRRTGGLPAHVSCMCRACRSFTDSSLKGRPRHGHSGDEDLISRGRPTWDASRPS